MSNKDYGTKLAESLRQIRQLDAQPAASDVPAVTAATPPPPAKPAVTPAKQPPSAPAARPKPPATTRGAAQAPSPLLHPARVWPD